MARQAKDPGRELVLFMLRSNDLDGLHRLLLDPQTRGMQAALAIDGLLGMDSSESWDALGDALMHCSGTVLEQAITQLGERGGRDAIRALGECLSNTDVFVRSQAVQALSRQHEGTTMPHLLRASRDPAPSIARLASRVVLRRVERNSTVLAEVSEATVEGILDLMDDRWAMELLSPSFPENIRMLAARRLGAIGGDEATQALVSVASHANGELAETCWRALESCSMVSEFILLPLLVANVPEVKARAIELYARYSSADAADLFVGMTRDAAPKVRLAAARALARVALEGAIPTLEALLDDIEEEVRCQAIDLLCSIEDSSPELLTAVHTQDGEVRRRALVALANRGIHHDSLIQPYIEFLYKGAACTDLSQRDYLDSLAVVAKALGMACNPDAMLALTALARSVIRRMRRAAIEGLMAYPPEERTDALFSLLDTYDPDVVKTIAFGLDEAGDPRAVMPLIRAALECRGKPMVRAKERLDSYPQINDVDFLIENLAARWPSLRRFAAERLKLVRDPRSIPALLTASRDENVEVQLAVFEAMGPFASENDEVRTRMLEAIGYGDISVRQSVCEALGEARVQEAVPDLIRALHNFFLRPRATQALRQIGDRKGFLALKRIEIRERLFKKKPDLKKQRAGR